MVGDSHNFQKACTRLEVTLPPHIRALPFSGARVCSGRGNWGILHMTVWLPSPIKEEFGCEGYRGEHCEWRYRIIVGIPSTPNLLRCTPSSTGPCDGLDRSPYVMSSPREIVVSYFPFVIETVHRLVGAGSQATIAVPCRTASI